mmetsp:Transcript_72848/g.207532  ORF Transcript_72848/g.207532 Transcript_72848/m.207532 type:complete len:211 (+) Transcript_72848:123-755(+)
MSLQFDEFQALRRRQQAAKQTREEDASEDASEVVSESSYASASAADAKKDAASAAANPNALSDVPTGVVGAASFFESFEVQLVTLILIALDVALAVTSLLLTCGNAPASSGLALAVLRVIETFTGFTVFYFLLELGALMFAFRSAFFGHIGNILDLAIVATCLVWEVDGRSRGASVVRRAPSIVPHPSTTSPPPPRRACALPCVRRRPPA